MTAEVLPDVAEQPLPPRPAVSYGRLARGLREFTTLYDELRDKTGPVCLVKLGPSWLVPPMAIATSPAGARAVLGGHGGLFDKHSLIHDEARSMFGLNLFSLPHAPWKARRRTIQPLFTRKHIASFAGHMGEAASGLAEEWRQSSVPLDLDHEMRRLTLSVLGRTLFGRPLHEDALELGPHIERPLRYVTKRGTAPVRAPSWLPTPARRRARASRDAITGLLQEVVDAASGATEGSGELVDLLLAARDPETGATLPPEMVAEELALFLIAGHDTTATSLTAALWHLGRNPEIQEAVADEARSIGRDLTLESLTRLPLTSRVLQEAMRLVPAAAAVARRATREASVCGFRVPAGTDVIVSIWAIHHDPEVWPEPMRFDPDRFLPERAKARDRWSYLPFGGGERSCIGDHFAFAEASIGLATLIQQFHVESLDEKLPLTVPFTLTVDGPIPATIRPR